VGLPHRNSSVFKQTHINQWEVKVVEVKTQASEAKGPFPGGKRVGSWGKKKNKRKEKAKVKAKEKVLLLRAYRQKKTPPTSMRWMGKGLFESH
jgi:hypothetical protein